MKKNYLNNLKINKVKIIKNKKGNILKLFNINNLSKKKNIEIYISEIKPQKIKAWRSHNLSTQNILILEGKCLIVLYHNNIYKKFLLTYKSNKILKIPPKIFYGYKNLGSNTVKILNLINMKYNDSEIIRLKQNSIKFNWQK